MRNIPHVGNATQADDDSLKPLWLRLFDLYSAIKHLIPGSSLLVTLEMIMC